MTNKRKILGHLGEELRTHLPYTFLFTAFGLVAAAALTFIGTDEGGGTARLVNGSRGLFHALHPTHLLLSATATTAMFMRHEKRPVKAALVGFSGALVLCGASDVFLPYLSGLLLATGEMEFHWCVIEHPQMALPFIALGVLGGLLAAGKIARATIFSHSGHVLASSLASLFYLIGYGVTGWMGETTLPLVFVIVVLCVTIPCCLSDIVFPLFFVRRAGAGGHGGDAHGDGGREGGSDAR